MTDAAIDADAVQVHVLIIEQADVAIARLRARDLALRHGLARAASEAVASAVSEIAHNITTHARWGERVMTAVSERGRHGLLVIARDAGPGIADPQRAMEDGFSTAGTLGLGLSAARRLMDEFDIRSTPGSGTTVVMKKWGP